MHWTPPESPYLAPQPQNTAPEKDIYTVSRLNFEAKRLLEGTWPRIWITGEISNFSTPASGHWYFKLKDDRAEIDCAMFRSANFKVQTKVQNGLQVILSARVSLYDARGNYQLIVDSLKATGDGLLQLQYETLKRTLYQEGLFNPQLRHPLPKTIQTLGIITSPSGAALQDVLSVLKRRDPSIGVIIYPALVQGHEAPASLLNALNLAIERQEVDALLVTRGGGSMEDLWCFNHEGFVRALAKCPLPTISAIGHEIDQTLTDFVVTLRAPTPSAAAEQLSAEQANKSQRIQELQQRLLRGWQFQSSYKKQNLLYLKQRLSHLDPQRQLEFWAQRLDELDSRLIRIQGRALEQRTLTLKNLQHRLRQQLPDKQVASYQMQLKQQQARLSQAITHFMRRQQENFQALQRSLILTSPLNTLARGYSITLDEEDQLIRQAHDVEVGQTIQTKLVHGTLVSRVEAIHTEDTQTNIKTNQEPLSCDHSDPSSKWSG